MCKLFDSYEENLHLGVCKLAKYVRNCVVFWKNYTADKNFTRPPVTHGGRDKFQVWSQISFNLRSNIFSGITCISSRSSPFISPTTSWLSGSVYDRQVLSNLLCHYIEQQVVLAKYLQVLYPLFSAGWLRALLWRCWTLLLTSQAFSVSCWYSKV